MATTSTPGTPDAIRTSRQTKHNSQAPAENKVVGETMLNCNAPSQPDNVASPKQP